MIPTSLRSSVLQEVHDHEFSGAHLGIKKSARKCQQHYWWNNWYKDVVYWVKSCKLCAARKPHALRNIGEMKNIPVPAQPWDLVGVDIVHMPKSKRGNEYAIVFMDYITKWPEVVPLRNIGAQPHTTHRLMGWLNVLIKLLQKCWY